MNPRYRRIGCAQTSFLEHESIALNTYTSKLFNCLPAETISSVLNAAPTDPDKLLTYLLSTVERTTQKAECQTYAKSVRQLIATNSLARSYQYCHAVYCRLDY